MKTQVFEIPAISCHHCVHTISSELSELPGVQDVSGDVSSKQVTVTYDAPVTEEEIRALLKEIEYEAL